MAVALLAAASAAPTSAVGTGGSTATLQPSVPHYRLALSFAEFSVLHDAAQAGVAKYGGDADLHVRLARSGDAVVWNVEITSTKLMEVLDYWMAERIAQLVGGLDFSVTLGDTARVALQTAKATHAKVREARQAPIYDVTTLDGVLERIGDGWAISTRAGRVPLTISEQLAGPAALAGHKVIATGIVRVAGTLDALRVLERRVNTLDLFVMSLCPFARRAEAEIIPRLLAARGTRPALQVHYIFYPLAAGPNGPYTCMHGEDEVRENLVQMLLRDEHPVAFLPYLQLRATSDEPWGVLAARAGLDAGDVLRISRRISADRQALIQHEYDYVARVCSVRDGSPTFLWESQSVDGVQNVPLLADVASPTGSCSAGD
jgi:hypothetical protein